MGMREQYCSDLIQGKKRSKGSLDDLFMKEKRNMESKDKP